MTEAEVIQLMLGATSEVDWDKRCDQVKAAHDGRYPAYWFEKINKSGLMSLVLASFADPRKTR